MKKVFFFDTETTGLDCKKQDIIQLAYMIEIDGEIKEEGSLYTQPFNYDTIQQEALNTNKLTVEQLKAFPSPSVTFMQLKRVLNKYIDKFNKLDKFSPAGYNVNFDVGFLREFFFKNKDKYYGSYFDYHLLDPIPVLHLLEYKGLIKLPNYKLVTVCEYFNINIDAHEALSDIKATRQVIQKLLTYINKKCDSCL
jgi:DNA polymerase-3 subunit epsilon